MSMAIRINGGYRLDTIVRQHNPASEETLRLTARMREASSLFVESGKSGINKNKEGSRADAENMSDEMKAASKKAKLATHTLRKRSVSTVRKARFYLRRMDATHSTE